MAKHVSEADVERYKVGRIVAGTDDSDDELPRRSQTTAGLVEIEKRSVLGADNVNVEMDCDSPVELVVRLCGEPNMQA